MLVSSSMSLQPIRFDIKNFSLPIKSQIKPTLTPLAPFVRAAKPTKIVSVRHGFRVTSQTHSKRDVSPVSRFLLCAPSTVTSLLTLTTRVGGSESARTRARNRAVWTAK